MAKKGWCPCEAGQIIRYYFTVYQAGHITLQTIKLGKNEINNKTLLCRLSSWTMRYYFTDYQAGQAMRYYFADYHARQ
jgi:hypothetical protein